MRPSSLAPLLLLFAVSFYADEQIDALGLRPVAKFYGEPFHCKVIGDTLLLGAEDGLATTVLLGYPLALVYRDRLGRACSRCCCSSSSCRC